MTDSVDLREAIARALIPHAYVSPFRCSCGWGVVRKLADESLESLFAQHQADAVLAALPEYEQVGWRRKANGSMTIQPTAVEREQFPDVWEPVYRRVVPVVPSPEPAEELLCHPGTPCSARCDRCCPAGYCKNCGKPMSGHGPLANCYPVAAPDRCPTCACPRCGSTDPKVCRYIILAGAPHPHGSRLECCPDPFHQQEAQ